MLPRSHVSPLRVTHAHFTSDQIDLIVIRFSFCFMTCDSADLSTETVWVIQTHRFHYGWKAPLCAEESFTAETSLLVDVSVQHIHPNHTGVHRVGVLLHSSLGHCFPRMTVVEKKTNKK